MTTELKICDVCRASADIELATVEYQNDYGELFHACEECLKLSAYIEKNVTQIFETPGDPNENILYE